MKTRVQETTQANVNKLRGIFNLFARDASLVRYRSMFLTFAAMLELDVITWKDIRAKLRQAPASAIPEPVKRKGLMRRAHSFQDGTGWMSQHEDIEEPERGRRARVPLSVDESHDATAASANRAKAPREDGNPQDVIDVMEYEEPELGRITRVQFGNPQAVPMVTDVKEHEEPAGGGPEATYRLTRRVRSADFAQLQTGRNRQDAAGREAEAPQTLPTPRAMRKITEENLRFSSDDLLHDGYSDPLSPKCRSSSRCRLAMCFRLW